MATLRIGIAPYEAMKARTLAIARGELKPTADEPKVWFTSAESFARVLSEKNRALLAEIAASSPRSLVELAGRTGRRTSNLSRTLKTMARYGFVRLREGEKGRIVPEVPYDEIALTVPLTRTARPEPQAGSGRDAGTR
jgi:predicted transcriptional regulator